MLELSRQMMPNHKIAPALPRVRFVLLVLAVCSFGGTTFAGPPRPSAGEPGDDCLKCHADQSGPLEKGMHPVAGTTDAQAAPSKNASCATCHSSHAAGRETPVAETHVSNQLCLSCHTRSHPEFFAPARVTPHNALDCMGCHAMHDAAGPTHLTTAPLADSSLCLGCHDDRDSILDTTHDLRGSAPKAANARGWTADQGGPCSACHNIHSEARPAVVGQVDPLGQCTPCHQTGGAASARTGRPFSHPTTIGADRLAALRSAVEVESDRDALACTDCHNPHGTDHTRYLREAPETICGACHTNGAALLNGLHDFRKRTDFKNAKGQSPTESGACGQCHTVHEAKGSGLWVGPTSNATAYPGAAHCTGCHAEGGLGPAVAYKPHPALLMHNPWDGSHPASMPLVSPDGSLGSMGFIACLTCHLPHGRQPTGRGGSSPQQSPDLAMLRAEKVMLRPYVAPTLCSTCHGFDGLRRFLRFHDLSTRSE